MGTAIIVVAIIMGALMLAPRFLQGSEDAAPVLEKINTFQSIIGVVVLVFSLIAFVVLVLSLSMYDLYRISLILTMVSLVVLGFLLSYELIVENVLAKNEETRAKAAELRAKLDQREEFLGILCIGLAVLTIILHSQS